MTSGIAEAVNALTLAILSSIALFVAMVACLESGYRIGLRHDSARGGVHKGTGAIEAAIFALLGLLLGFAFAGGTARLDYRRELIVREVNAVGTAYLRLDLASSTDQADLRRLFRGYLQARLRVYENTQDAAVVASALAQVAELQQQIWVRAVAASDGDPSGDTARLLLPAINEMIDITTTRTVALTTRLPLLIRLLLVVVALLSAQMAGYSMAERGTRSWLHMLVYAAAVSITFYAVLDLDNPRAGFIRLDSTEAILRDLLESID